MRVCIEHLREGWYGNEAYRQWVADGRKIPDKLQGEKGERLRRQQARRRFGKKKTAADWIPANCCRPVNCGGLVRKVKEEANEMITNMYGLAGTIDALTWDEEDELVTFTEAGRMDLCDLTGVDTSQLIGNDVQLTDRGLELSTDPEDLEDDDEELQFCNCCQGWLDPEEFFDEEEETLCMQCMDEEAERILLHSS